MCDGTVFDVARAGGTVGVGSVEKSTTDGRAGTPTALFQTHIAPGPNRSNYDVARDGRFVINTALDDASAKPIHLRLNWTPPLK